MGKDGWSLANNINVARERPGEPVLKRRTFRLAGRGGPQDSVGMQLQIEYPDSLPDLLQTTRPQFEAEARMAMAVKLFERQRLPSGLAARLAGVSRVEFLLTLHRYGVPMIDLDEAELRDVQHA